MNILVFGDSITQGFYDTEKGGWVNRLFIDVSASVSQTGTFVGVFNLGIDSESTTGLCTRLENEILARRSEEMVIIFDIGGNDTFKSTVTGTCAVPFATFSENYATIIEVAKKYGQVFCLGLHDFNPEQATQSPWYREYDLFNKEDEQYNLEIQRLSAKYEVKFISMKGLLAADFETYSHDGDHPTAEGHRLIYERVKTELEKAKLF